MCYVDGCVGDEDDEGVVFFFCVHVLAQCICHTIFSITFDGASSIEVPAVLAATISLTSPTKSSSTKQLVLRGLKYNAFTAQCQYQ